MSLVPKSFWAISAFVIIASVTCYWSAERSLRFSFSLLCHIVQEGIYRKGPALDRWTDACIDDARLISSARRSRFVAVFNDELSLLGLSHLHIYAPADNRRMWDNVAVDNGLRARIIEDALIVYDVVPGSAGLAAGVQVGDEVISVNGASIGFSDSVSELSGEFGMRRLSTTKDANSVATGAGAAAADLQEVRLNIKAVELEENLAPKFFLNSDAGVLRIASFLPKYFEAKTWRDIIAQAKDARDIIVDVRGNAGGSFPAMLRALSPFFCGVHPVGVLSADVPESSEETVASISTATDSYLKDDLAADSQVEQLEENPVLGLQTFADYGCLHATRITVLVDADTSSVAEIFAEAISHRAARASGVYDNSIGRTALADKGFVRVWGVPTAGQVVMARWYDLDALGFGGYTLSLPIATYITSDGREMEAEGVAPAKLLFYDLQAARAGRDSWLEAATAAK